jgi:hypothetical protein
MGKVLPGILAAQLEICFQCFQLVVNGQPARLRSRERARADHIRADFPQTGFQNLFGGLWVRALRALAEILWFFFLLRLWTTTFSRKDGFTRRVRFQPNVTLLHSDRLVSTALSFIFLNVTFQRHSRRIASSVGTGKAL